MSQASLFPPRGLFASNVRGPDAMGDPVSRQQQDSGSDLPDPYAGESKWAPWKVTLFVIVFCGAFWAGVAWLVTRLFS